MLFFIQFLLGTLCCYFLPLVIPYHISLIIHPTCIPLIHRLTHGLTSDRHSFMENRLNQIGDRSLKCLFYMYLLITRRDVIESFVGFVIHVISTIRILSLTPLPPDPLQIVSSCQLQPVELIFSPARFDLLILITEECRISRKMQNNSTYPNRCFTILFV